MTLTPPAGSCSVIIVFNILIDFKPAKCMRFAGFIYIYIIYNIIFSVEYWKENQVHIAPSVIMSHLFSGLLW